MNPKINSEASRYGDVSGYVGSRCAKPAPQGHFDKIPNVPVVLPTSPTARNALIPRHRIEVTAANDRPSDEGLSTLVPRQYSGTISVAGVVPTAGEIATALASVYTGGNNPKSDDLVLLNVSGVLKFSARARIANPGTSGIFCVSFTVGATTFYAVLNQTGIY